MSVTAAIVTRYDSESDDDIVALRNTLGTNKLWPGRAPKGTALPYATVNHTSTSLFTERKGQDKRVEDCTIQIDVWAVDQSTVETILDQCEDAYIGHALTLTSTKAYMGTYLSNRWTDEEKVNLWRGQLELTVRQQK